VSSAATALGPLLPSSLTPLAVEIRSSRSRDPVPSSLPPFGQPASTTLRLRAWPPRPWDRCYSSRLSSSMRSCSASASQSSFACSLHPARPLPELLLAQRPRIRPFPASPFSPPVVAAATAVQVSFLPSGSASSGLCSVLWLRSGQ
jgi:hypothetical protein